MPTVKSLVYGGCYKEICITPHHDQIMGSGLRAAMALSALSLDTQHTWYTRLSDADHHNVKGVLTSLSNIKLVEIGSSGRTALTPGFHYLNPLTPPVCFDTLEINNTPTPELKAESALVFGTLENRPCISANTVVYDPQNPDNPDQYFDNGSTASRCALVLNHKEATKLACDKDIYSASKLLQSYLLKGCKPAFDVVVIKMSHAGCWVCTHDDIIPIPAYRTDSVFSIGSGDIFSTAFYIKWALENDTAPNAANFASQLTAHYCASGVISSGITLPENAKSPLPTINPHAPAFKKRIYLAAPFFDQGQIVLVEYLRDLLTTPWSTVFSPFHEVGYGGPAEVYAPDIKGLEESDIIFAVLSGLDTGTIFEVGYASKIPKPIFCLAEAVPTMDLTMILGSGAVVEADITTAVYKTLWATMN